MKDHLSWETVFCMRRCEVEQEFTKAPPKSPQFSTRLRGVTTHKIVVFVIITVSCKRRTHDSFVGFQSDLFEIGKAVKTNSPI